jgi:type I restriction enzyme S subunit
MKLETFFEKFDQFADAPDAIPAMRELLIQLAVRGNLTERMSGESSKAQLALAEAFRIRRAKREEPDAKDVPFPVPDNWGWVAVGDSMDMFNGRAFKPEEWSTQGTPIIRIQNLNNEHAAFNRCKAELDPKIHVHDGDFLISWSGTPGTSFGAFIWNRGFAFLNQHIFRCEVVTGVFEKKFLRLAINARLDEMISQAQGAVGLRHITKGKLESIRLPLPPLAEQKRIVAKVDELMALCDRLEAQQQERETRHAALARASLARFADAPTPANLHFLFHPSYAISPADLRKSILTLAVQGKLVPQDTNDEPADSILRATHSFFDRLVAAKKLSAPKPLPPIEDDEVPFSLPIGWAWCRFGQIMRISSGDGLVAKDMNAGPIPVYGGNGVNGYHDAHNVAKRTLVIGRVGFYCGSIHVTPERAWVTDNAFITTFDEEHVDMDFLSWLLKATDLRERDNATAQPVISGGKVYPTVLAVPPLAEQRRIVAKVEQLMSLVDALEMQLATSCATGEKLLAAVVAELTEGTHASPAC